MSSQDETRRKERSRHICAVQPSRCVLESRAPRPGARKLLLSTSDKREQAFIERGGGVGLAS